MTIKESAFAISRSQQAAGYVDECRRQEELAFTAVTQNQAECDKQLLTLSAAFIAALLAFLKQVVPGEEIIAAYLLYLSLILLVGTIVFVIASYQLSNHAHYRVMDYWKTERDHRASASYPNQHVKVVELVNRMSAVTFVAGLAFAIAFASLNINKSRGVMNIQDKSTKVNDGAPVRPGPNPSKEQVVRKPAPASPKK